MKRWIRVTSDYDSYNKIREAVTQKIKHDISVPSAKPFETYEDFENWFFFEVSNNVSDSIIKDWYRTYCEEVFGEVSDQ